MNIYINIASLEEVIVSIKKQTHYHQFYYDLYSQIVTDTNTLKFIPFILE